MDGIIKVLFVDDEVNMLNSVRRQLRGQYDLKTAESGKEGLEILVKTKDVAVIISDYKMPKMNGLEFLMQAKETSPDSVRMMLTGQADFDAVINVINESNIFRFLTKPCPPELLIKNIDDAIRQYQLITLEKDLLSKTLSGSLQVMTDILVLAKPDAFNRGIRIKNIINKMLELKKIEKAWQIEIAAMLSQIGCITIPDSILKKVYTNHELTPEEMALYKLHPKTSSELIIKIPRLEKVAEIIAYQEKNFNGIGYPNDNVKGEDIPLGARMIHLVSDYDLLKVKDISDDEAFEMLSENEGAYDPSLFPLLKKTLSTEPSRKKYINKQIPIDELNEKMYLAKDITTASGVIIGNARQRISQALIITLKNYVKNKEIINIIPVYMSVD